MRQSLWKKLLRIIVPILQTMRLGEDGRQRILIQRELLRDPRFH